MKNLLIVYFNLIFVLGCATTLTDNGRFVRVVKDPVLVKGCRYIDSVEGNFQESAFTTGKGLSSTVNQLKNKAAEIGANRVLLSGQHGSSNLYGIGNVSMMGDAYRCKRKRVDISEENKTIINNRNIINVDRQKSPRKGNNTVNRRTRNPASPNNQSGICGKVGETCAELGALEEKKGNISKARRLYKMACKSGHKLACRAAKQLER